MDATTLRAVALVGGVLGVASHLGYFIHGEHHMNGIQILLSFSAVTAFLFITVLRLDDEKSILAGSQVTGIASGSYFGALITSILAYRVFFHPLRSFPGPVSVRLSKIFHTLRIGTQSQNNVQADQLHQKYGEFVRLVSILYWIPQALFAVKFELTYWLLESAPTNLQPYLRMLWLSYQVLARNAQRPHGMNVLGKFHVPIDLNYHIPKIKC